MSASTPLSPSGHDEEKTDEDGRSALFERLQQFYLKWEGERVHQGIGHIVDWAIANGEDALNERLMQKYGENLSLFEDGERAAENKAGTRRADRPAESFLSHGSQGSLGSMSSAGFTLRDRLLAFYSRYDPDRAQKGVDDLVDYVTRKGLPTLNKKLQAKYGLTLEDFENGVQGQKPEPKPQNGRLSMRRFLRRSFRAAHTNAGPGQLPPHIRPLLEMYYSKYDQSKINSGGVNAIYKWCERNGVKALNSQLKAKYLEDLDEFADRMNKLREDLVEFYKVHDPSKIDSSGVDRILRWGVRNGRAAINKQLRAKYHCDLEQRDPGKVIEEEPEF